MSYLVLQGLPCQREPPLYSSSPAAVLIFGILLETGKRPEMLQAIKSTDLITTFINLMCFMFKPAFYLVTKFPQSQMKRNMLCLFIRVQ